MLNLLLGPVSSIVKDAVGGYVQTKKAKLEQKVTKINAETDILKKQISGEIQYDVEAIKGAKDSFKDEWITLVFTIIHIAHFVPYTQPIMREGWDILANASENFWYLLFVIVGGSFGMTTMKKLGKK